jgi:hypothetical protein
MNTKENEMVTNGYESLRMNTNICMSTNEYEHMYEYERIRTTMIGEGGTGRVGLLGKKCSQIKTDCETKSSLSFHVVLSFAFNSVLCIISIHF